VSTREENRTYTIVVRTKVFLIKALSVNAMVSPSIEIALLFADRFCRQAILYLSRNYLIKGGTARADRVPIARIDERRESSRLVPRREARNAFESARGNDGAD